MDHKTLKTVFTNATEYDGPMIEALYQNIGKSLAEVMPSLPSDQCPETVRQRYFRNPGSHGYTFALFILKGGFIHLRAESADMLGWLVHSDPAAGTGTGKK